MSVSIIDIPSNLSSFEVIFRICIKNKCVFQIKIEQ